MLRVWGQVGIVCASLPQGSRAPVRPVRRSPSFWQTRARLLRYPETLAETLDWGAGGWFQTSKSRQQTPPPPSTEAGAAAATKHDRRARVCGPPPDPPPRGVASEGDSTTTTTPRIEDAIAAAAAAAAAATIAAPKKTSWASVARRGTDDARADDDGAAFERTENDEENQKVEVEEKETFGVAEEETFGDAEEEIRCDINIPNVPSAFVAKYLPRDVDLDATEEAREGDGVVTRRVAAAKKLGELVADVGVGRVGKGAYSLHWSPCDRVRAAHADP